MNYKTVLSILLIVASAPVFAQTSGQPRSAGHVYYCSANSSFQGLKAVDLNYLPANSSLSLGSSNLSYQEKVEFVALQIAANYPHLTHVLQSEIQTFEKNIKWTNAKLKLTGDQYQRWGKPYQGELPLSYTIPGGACTLKQVALSNVHGSNNKYVVNTELWNKADLNTKAILAINAILNSAVMDGTGEREHLQAETVRMMVGYLVSSRVALDSPAERLEQLRRSDFLPSTAFQAEDVMYKGLNLAGTVHRDQAKGNLQATKSFYVDDLELSAIDPISVDDIRLDTQNRIHVVRAQRLSSPISLVGTDWKFGIVNGKKGLVTLLSFDDSGSIAAGSLVPASFRIKMGTRNIKLMGPPRSTFSVTAIIGENGQPVIGYIYDAHLLRLDFSETGLAIRPAHDQTTMSFHSSGRPYVFSVIFDKDTKIKVNGKTTNYKKSSQPVEIVLPDSDQIQIIQK